MSAGARARASAAVGIALFCVVASAPAARGDAPVDPIAAARTALEDLRFEDAIALVHPLLESRSRRERAAALEITAIAELVLGQQVQGAAAVADLYELAPGFLLSDPGLPPRVITVFESEAARPHARGVSPSARPRGQDPLEFELRAGKDTARVELSCRSAATGPFTPVATTAAGELHRFRLPSPNTYRCYAVALDADGLALGRLGTTLQPFELRPRPAPPPASAPLPARWWFWAGLAVLAAGTTVVVVAATRSGASSNAPPADITATAKAARWAW